MTSLPPRAPFGKAVRQGRPTEGRFFKETRPRFSATKQRTNKAPTDCRNCRNNGSGVRVIDRRTSNADSTSRTAARRRLLVGRICCIVVPSDHPATSASRRPNRLHSDEGTRNTIARHAAAGRGRLRLVKRRRAGLSDGHVARYAAGLRSDTGLPGSIRAVPAYLRSSQPKVTVTVVLIPPRGVNAAVSVSRRGSTTAAKSSRIRFTAFS